MKKHALIIIIFINLSCLPENPKFISKESHIDISKTTKMKIPIKYDNELQGDSIFNEIVAIPLETNKHCLLSDIRETSVIDSCIFINSNQNNLFVFSLVSGKFIREIGRKGKGPGEFFGLRDFDIDEEGNIYILDFQKILKYSEEGEFLEKYSFKFNRDDVIYCNPLRFSLCGKENFYIWAGSSGLKNNKNNNFFVIMRSAFQVLALAAICGSQLLAKAAQPRKWNKREIC